MEEFNIDNFLRVSVLRSGKLLADGAEIRLDELEARLSTLDREKCGLWLYEEPGGESMSSPFAMDVLKLIFDHAPALSISHRPDFSDTIWEHTPHPRIHNFLRVSVLRSGKLLAGGAEIRLDELEARLSTLDREKCGLWLYEEPGGESRPPPLADEVKSLIGKLVFEDIPPLYVRVSKKADFSDAIAE